MMMSWTNYHSHNTFCDGRASMEEFVKYAIAKGVRKYGFSSHAPLPFHTHWTMNAEDYPEYEIEFYRLKEKYKDYIELFLGLEIDYIHGYSNAKSAFFQTITLDYAIGSIHYLDKLADGSYWSIDGPFTDFDKGLNELFDGDIRLATERFYHISNCMIEVGGFDIVGHFDKITLHGSQYTDFDTDALWYRNLVGESLQQVKNKGLILEINTKSLTERGMTFPENNLLQLIHDLQIPITVNSDCHYPSRVIDGFELTYLNLKKVGFKELQQLVDGKWQAELIQ
ncbi:MAG: histidinol-phosphatase [Paludibacter sp.]